MSKSLSPQDLVSRLTFDWRIIRTMSSAQYVFTAHRTAQHAAAGTSPIGDERDARYAMHYRLQFNIPTLIGPGQYSPMTIIRVDIADPGYPFTQPTSWVVENGVSRLPYSPHFAHGTPVCNGSSWRSDGRYTLGHYAVHLAHLLNWDEQLAHGYDGYNRAAINWWRKNLNRPISPELIYPALPIKELYGDVKITTPSAAGFRAANPTGSQPAGGFRRAG